MRHEAQYLWDVIDAADAIERFIGGRSESEFQQDELIRSAVHSKLMIIGEAVSQLSEQLTDRYPEVPWRKTRGFRNAMIHGYFKIDWDIVWGAATKDVSALTAVVTQILATEYPHIRPD
ncbi:MAG TPA: DUF86 domain-containing protein [Phycisphaerae bacterium]|nr:DUF86 domain-containing protein [Phycisphaerae bacterium]